MPQRFTRVLRCTCDFSGNPVEETYSREGTWRDMIADLLPGLKILDGNYLPCL